MRAGNTHHKTSKNALNRKDVFVKAPRTEIIYRVDDLGERAEDLTTAVHTGNQLNFVPWAEVDEFDNKLVGPPAHAGAPRYPTGTRGVVVDAANISDEDTKDPRLDDDEALADKRWQFLQFFYIPP